MKHRILCAALAILLLMAPAYAESLSATREGNELNITGAGVCCARLRRRRARSNRQRKLFRASAHVERLPDRQSGGRCK